MHCFKCKTIIDKAVLIVDTLVDLNDDDPPKRYCKKCFVKEFMNE